MSTLRKRDSDVASLQSICLCV